MSAAVVTLQYQFACAAAFVLLLAVRHANGLGEEDKRSAGSAGLPELHIASASRFRHDRPTCE